MKHEAVRKKKEKGERKKGKEKRGKKKGKRKKKKRKRGSDFFVNIWHTLVDNITFHGPLRRKMAAGEKYKNFGFGEKIRRGKTVFHFPHPHLFSQ